MKARIAQLTKQAHDNGATVEILVELAEACSEAGAKKALHAVGLQDEDAGQDIADLRTLLGSWRSAKKIIGRTVLSWLTVAVLTALAGLAAMRWLTGGPP